MSEGNYWTQHPGIIVLIFLSLFAAGLVWMYFDGVRYIARLEKLAARHGWGFSRGDEEGLYEKIRPLFRQEKLIATMIRKVETGSRNIRLFDCAHSERSTSDQDLCCFVESPRFHNNGGGKDMVEIIARTPTDNLLARDRVDMGDSEFSRNFIVISKNPAAAKNVVTPALQALLLGREARPYFVEIRINAAGAVALAWRPGGMPEDRMLDLIELCRRVEQSMP